MSKISEKYLDKFIDGLDKKPIENLKSGFISKWERDDGAVVYIYSKDMKRIIDAEIKDEGIIYSFTTFKSEKEANEVILNEYKNLNKKKGLIEMVGFDDNEKLMLKQFRPEELMLAMQLFSNHWFTEFFTASNFDELLNKALKEG